MRLMRRGWWIWICLLGGRSDGVLYYFSLVYLLCGLIKIPFYGSLSKSVYVFSKQLVWVYSAYIYHHRDRQVSTTNSPILIQAVESEKTENITFLMSIVSL